MDQLVEERATGSKYGLYAICFGFFLVLLDTSALNVAIVAMQREFGGAINGLQWVVNSYTIVFASFLLACGALADRFGAKRCYQLGLFLFTGMSLLCALSPGIGFLIGARGFQGLGAAIMLPASLAILTHTFPNPEERGRAVSFWAGVVSLGFAAGPALGGILTNYFGWRAIFWINVPTGLIAIVMVYKFIGESKEAHPRRIDLAGQASAAGALFCISYGLITAGVDGWTSARVLLAFAGAISLVIALVVVERKSESPVLPRSLFSNVVFSVSIAMGVILNFGIYGTLFLESIYLQNVRHLNPLSAGLMILPFTVLPTITTRLATRYSGRSHVLPRLVVGQLVAAAATATLAASLWISGYWAILLGLGLWGIAMGVIMPAMTTGVLISSEAHNSGLASGILNSARQVGGALGVALMGTLAQIFKTQGMLLSFGAALVLLLVTVPITLRAYSQRTT
jgi:DHA2 family methylenomycin A resistance protein-like MFS transporter